MELVSLHQQYRFYFNNVDLIAYQYRTVEEHHQHHCWKTKFILVILHLAIQNAWTWTAAFPKPRNLLNFREQAGIQLRKTKAKMKSPKQQLKGGKNITFEVS